MSVEIPLNSGFGNYWTRFFADSKDPISNTGSDLNKGTVIHRVSASFPIEIWLHYNGLNHPFICNNERRTNCKPKYKESMDVFFRFIRNGQLGVTRGSPYYAKYQEYYLKTREAERELNDKLNRNKLNLSNVADIIQIETGDNVIAPSNIVSN